MTNEKTMAQRYKEIILSFASLSLRSKGRPSQSITRLAMPTEIELHINDATHRLTVEPERNLLSILRDEIESN